ncbi:MAG: hypothetical protein AAB573_03345 [Patescibacteria group bacterium]
MSTHPRGFTLLMAILTAGIMLALGYAIFNIVSKEILLSSAGRESQFAFFAADTGIECALYYDSKFDAFSTSSPLVDVSCGAASSTLVREIVGTSATTTFSFQLSSSITRPCVTVIVAKSVPAKTKIESAGYNTCVTTNPRRIERAIRVTY